ncbi:SET domain-containing protein-lysine N-methyltransferase [Mesorhizobium sp.]|uniref:SET domain-containing protein-lysine N-methyltransferase n=1 Tax=Mesorhizobium sp. TaxID=1871066 RepID=UPI000FE56001|nr:SET domain-containing protein-lysine N-methyltransferase [Mesorhizobium sp.]RWM78452.1 MAG: SET domain-containing protein-lysine N-methyltransferase [Mesorhizobium sp.]
MHSAKKESAMADQIFDRSHAVYVKHVPCKGRGLFANVPFKIGDVIDRAPTWEFDTKTAILFRRTGLFQYYFVRDDLGEKAALVAGYVVFGFISIVNHSSNPNAQTIWSDGDAGASATIVAIRDIKVGEEITHRYKNISDYPSTIKFVE